MYITKCGVGNNKYVRLVECFRDKETGKNRTRILKNFGRYDELVKDDPLAFEKLKEKYRDARDQKTDLIKRERHDFVEKILNTTHQEINKSKSAALKYGQYILKTIWDNELNLDRKIRLTQARKYKNIKYDLNSALKYLVFNRIIAPYSIYAQYGSKDHYLGDPLKNISLDNLYQCLDFAKESKDDIMKWVNKSLDEKFGKTRATLIFYDVTNCYFESPLTDFERNLEQKDYFDNVKKFAQEAVELGLLPPDSFDSDNNLVINDITKAFIDDLASEKIQFLKMRGPSKEHRFDLPIVSIALIIDKNGIPMDFSVYAGNDSEFTSLRKSITVFKNKYEIDDIIVSADRGINSVQNLQLLKDLGFGFVVAQKVSQFTGELYDMMMDEEKYSLIDSSNPDKGRFLVIKDWTKKGVNGKSINCTLVITYNEKRRKRDEAILNNWKTIVENKIKNGEKIQVRKSGWASLAKLEDNKNGQNIIGIDENVYNKSLKLCGYAALVFDVPNNTKNKHITAREIISYYKKQNEIESCFRILKHNLDIRPMYVWTSNHIKGHVTVCVLSLIILKLIQYKLYGNDINLSINDICKILKEAFVIAISPSEGHENDNALFFTFEYKNYRRGHERMSDKDLKIAITRGEICQYSVDNIMEAVGLTPLSTLCTQHELARSLGTRFHSLADAVPEMALL